MRRGEIVGEVWATRKAKSLQAQGLKLVAMFDEGTGRPSGRVVVATDTLDARTGQQVLVAFGSGARNVVRPGPANRDVLCDAAIALLLDGASAHVPG